MRLFSTVLAAMLAGAGCMAGTPGKVDYVQKLKKADIHNLVSVPGMVDRSNASVQMQKAGFAKVKNAPTRANDETVAAFSAESYGWVTGPDKNNWYFTQESTFRDSVYSEYYTAQFYETSEITVYDNNHEQVGKFSVKVPEGWSHVSNIEAYGPITKNLFDKDTKSYEIMVEIHDTYNGSNKYITRAYDITTGEVKYEHEGTGVIFQSQANSWTLYQRLIMTNEIDGKYNVDVVAPPTWGKTAAYIEHTFSVDIDNRINYLQSSCFNCMDVDGTPYYVLASYDKPFTSTDASDSDTDITQNPDNFFTLRTFNKNYTQIDSVSVSVNTPEDVPYRTAAFGLFGNKDLSQGYYSDNGKLNYVIELLDYTPSLDGDLASFAVYDSEHGKLKDICDKVSDSQWATLNTIHGKSDQMWFLQTLGTSSENSTQQIQVVNVPSCEKATVLPQSIDGNSISSNFDRYATTANAEGYQYVIALSNAEESESSDVMAPIAWVNPDCTIDHKDVLNLGPSAEYFTPLINSTSLNPYLFNTDDDMEYVYIAKKRRDDGSNKLDNVLEVAKTDGTILKSWRGDDNNVFTSSSLPQMNSNGKHEMVVVFQNYETGKYDMSFYQLPFSKFTEGGDGSVENPYIISTVGDLQQLPQEPTKAYKIVNDIDMAKSANYWTPVESFTGVLDGGGHVIYNLGINTSNSHAGFFGNLDIAGEARNIVFVTPTIELTSTNQYAGVLAAEASYDYEGQLTGKNADNIFVYNANIYGDVDAVVGGLVGSQNLMSYFANCAFEGTINVPNAQNVGGIAGKQCTGSTIQGSYANVNAIAGANLGGIVGSAGSTQDGNYVLNCEARGTLTAQNNVGGIMGNSYANRVQHCISTADITATSPSRWAGYATGGIIGNLQADWGSTGSYYVIDNCLFAGSIKATDENGNEVSNPSTTHQIVGRTIADESYEPDEEVQTENRLRGNYTTTNVGNTDAAGVEGAYKASADLSKEFFETEGFAYGTTLDQPWKESSSNTPTLYFNNIAKALYVSNEDVTVGTNEDGGTAVTVKVYGMDDVDLESDLEVKASNSNASVSVGQAEGNAITLIIKGVKQGLSSVAISYGNLSANIAVTVLNNYVSGIDNVETTEFAVNANQGEISAEGAKSIEVYNLGGQLVGKTNGAAFSTSKLVKGVYVAKAISQAGKTATLKFVVK